MSVEGRDESPMSSSEPGSSSGARQGVRSQHAPQQRSSRGPFLMGCLVALAAVGTVIVLLVVGIMLMAAAIGGTVHTEGVYEAANVQELTVSGTPGDPKIAVVPVRGLLASGANVLTGSDPALVFKAMLERAKDDPKVRGVILAVDSPGGGITTCDVMHKALKDFRKESGRPSVVLMEDVAASGGYYVACGADYIIAHPTSITGSIGVLMPLLDAGDLMAKIGLTDRTVKSGEFKTMGSMFTQRTPEQWKREKEVLEGLITQMHERFVEVVVQGRKLAPDMVRAVADGRIYTSRQAVENGLVDAIGYHEDAVDKVKELAGITSAHVVRYTRVLSLREMLFARAGGNGLALGLDGRLPAHMLSRPMYVWPAAAFQAD